MDLILLDSDVFSYLMTSGDPRGEPYRRHLVGKSAAVSPITAGEVLFGAMRRGWSARRIEELKEKLRGYLLLDSDFQVCLIFAELKAQLHAEGRVLEDNDLWIAAFALRYSIPLVSNNRRHFERIAGLMLISEAPE